MFQHFQIDQQLFVVFDGLYFTVNLYVLPLSRVSEVLFKDIDFKAISFTVTLQLYFLPDTVAVIVAVPFFFAVTLPFLDTVVTF